MSLSLVGKIGDLIVIFWACFDERTQENNNCIIYPVLRAQQSFDSSSGDGFSPMLCNRRR